MATTIQKYLESASASNVNVKSKEAVQWFRTNITRNFIEPSKLMREEKANLINSWTNVSIGKMYMVYYDPKHKETLPYYDRFPLVIPIEKYGDGFLGLNLHYLPLPLRAKLLDALLDTVNNNYYNDRTKMKISYDILKSASRYKYFKPCIKRYLGNHFRSRFIKVETKAWPIATFLPVESFEKAKKSVVWKDSRGKI